MARKLIVLGIVGVAMSMSGCAVGSATAAYAMRAKTAEELTPDAEKKLVDRVQAELSAEPQKR